MICYSKQTDEQRDAGDMECWCLHGAVGMAADWREMAKTLASRGIGTRAVDLWRFLEPGPLPIRDFGKTLNHDAKETTSQGAGRALLGYSMGGRLALHALLAADHPWQAAVVISTHPGLERADERAARCASDAAWATQAITTPWDEFLTRWNHQKVLEGAIPRDPGTRQTQMGRRREIAQSFIDWSLGAQDSLWERLGEILVPVLWIAGENDVKFREIGARAVATLPRAQLVIAPGAGHRVPWEAAEWLAEQVSGFLRTGLPPV